MNVNIKWLEDTNKISKLEKMGISGVNDKVKDVKPATDEKKKLESEKKELSEKYSEIFQEITDLEVEIKKVEMEKEEFETAVGSTGPNTGVAGKDGKGKSVNFKIDYNYSADLETFYTELLSKKLDNLYEIDWQGKKYKTIEEVGTMRIAFEVCW